MAVEMNCIRVATTGARGKGGRQNSEAVKTRDASSIVIFSRPRRTLDGMLSVTVENPAFY